MMHHQQDLAAFHRELIELDHNYAKPFVNQEVNDKTKLLFLKPFVRSQSVVHPINPYEWVEVEDTTDVVGNNSNSFASININSQECQILSTLFANDKEGSSILLGDDLSVIMDDEENEDCGMLTDMENKLSKLKVDTNLFKKIHAALEKYEIRRSLSLKDIQSRMAKSANVINQLHYEAVSKKIRFFYATAQWKLNVCGWVHACLLELLSKPLLSLYINALKTLHIHGKIPALIEELNQCATLTQYVNRFPIDKVVKLIKSDDVTKPKLDVDLSWPLSQPRPVAVCLTFPMVSHSKRLSRFLQITNNFCQVITPKSDGDTGDSAPSLKMRLHQLKRKLLHEINSGHPVFLIGWGAASLLAMVTCLQLNRHEQQSQNSQTGKDPNVAPATNSLLGVICLGLAVRGLRGNRGGIDDPLLSLRTPALWVTGENSLSGPPEEAEVMRERMKHCDITLVRVGGCDHLLRMSRRWKMGHKVTQEHVDAKIGREILEFMSDRMTQCHANKSDTDPLTIPPGPLLSTSMSAPVTRPNTATSFSDILERCVPSSYALPPLGSTSKSSNYSYSRGLGVPPPTSGVSVRGGVAPAVKRLSHQSGDSLLNNSPYRGSPSIGGFNQRSKIPARLPSNHSLYPTPPSSDPYSPRTFPTNKTTPSIHRASPYQPNSNQSRLNQKHRARIMGPGARYPNRESPLARRPRGSPMTNPSYSSYSHSDSNWSQRYDEPTERSSQKSFLLSQRMRPYPPSPSRAARIQRGAANNFGVRSIYSELDRMNPPSSLSNQMGMMSNEPPPISNSSSNQESELEQAISSII